MTYQESGSGTLVLENRKLQLEVGELALRLHVGSEAQHRLQPGQCRWLVPIGDWAGARWEPLATSPAVMPGSHPATALLARMGRDLAASAGTLPAMLRNQFFKHLLGMIEDSLAHARPRDAELSRLARFHLRRIEFYLQSHLRDPTFSVSKMAVALGLSVSHVNRLFAGEGLTVREWIRTERLDGCAADLSAPALAHLSVGVIAHAWGFNNLSHFSSAFRKRFGMSPREWR